MIILYNNVQSICALVTEKMNSIRLKIIHEAVCNQIYQISENEYKSYFEEVLSNLVREDVMSAFSFSQALRRSNASSSSLSTLGIS
jgi:hypothetical protein